MSKVLCLVALTMVLIIAPSLAQDLPGCVNELADPCGPFINSTTATPPETCCDPLNNVLKNEVGCICEIFSSIELIQTLSLNVTEALTLPQRCGIKFDITAACEALAPSEAPSMAPSTGLNEVSGAIMLRNVGSLALGCFLIWATLMFY